MDYKKFFKGKRITLMGLGLLGRGLGDAIFLAEHGAELIITDLRDTKALAPSLKKLKKFKNIRYTLGEHKFGDFINRDFILKAAGVTLDSPYIAEAKKHGIPIEMDASLFAKLMPKGVTLVGVTGTRGKSTVTALIYDILCRGSTSIGKEVEPRIHKGGNLVPKATLPLLEKVKSGDIVVLELDSWQLQGFYGAKISPHVAVFTTFLDDHLVYYKGDRKRYFEDKAAIFRYQKKGDVLIVGEHVSSRFNLKSGKRLNLKNPSVVVARSSDIPRNWKSKLLGEHNRENIACAIAAARALGVSDSVIKKAVESFRGVPGRFEYMWTVRGVKIYNDNNATTPDATIAALRALCSLGSTSNSGLEVEPKEQNLILIMGGTDKGLDMSKLVAEISQHCKAVVMLKESGTEKLLSEFPGLKSPLIKGVAHSDVPGVVSPLGKGVPRSDAGRVVFVLRGTLKECVVEAMKIARKEDIILFSPAFASFGRWFKNEYDRGEQFVKIIDRIK